jgi:Uri superfamily endonuclease
MKRGLGTYVLFLAPHASVAIQIGKLGSIRFESPVYAYVGSAFGPGGLAARLARHLSSGKRPHWHIDFLRESADIVRVWTIEGHGRLECRVAELLATIRGAATVPGFGASDCRCASHLAGLGRQPSLARFQRRLREAVPRSSGLHIREFTRDTGSLMQLDI